jgi:histone-lysine N-methyltransferase SETMAR
VNVEAKEQSMQWMHAHSPNKPAKFKQTLFACQKAGQLFWSADDGIHATRDHNNVRLVLRNAKKKLRMAIRNKRHGMLTYGVVLFHDNARPHTAARTRALLEHFNWELFDHPPYSPDLAPSDYDLFTCAITALQQ